MKYVLNGIASSSIVNSKEMNMRKGAHTKHTNGSRSKGTKKILKALTRETKS